MLGLLPSTMLLRRAVTCFGNIHKLEEFRDSWIDPWQRKIADRARHSMRVVLAQRLTLQRDLQMAHDPYDTAEVPGIRKYMTRLSWDDATRFNEVGPPFDESDYIQCDDLMSVRLASWPLAAAIHEITPDDDDHKDLDPYSFPS